MQEAELSERVLITLKDHGYEGKIVSIECIQNLEKEMSDRREGGSLDDNLFEAYLNRFAFSREDDSFNSQSVIIATAPQPQLKVTFRWQGSNYSCLLPPTYDCATDQQITDTLCGILKPEGYHLEKRRLPHKILAVRSGLAQYGKNNITYVQGLGSFHRLVAFVTDLPCGQDGWQKHQMMEDCRNCDACRNACPTSAISTNRFLLYGERCLTFHNEQGGEFAEWVKPSWHHCLVGCMICQKVCPANKGFRKWVAEGPVFSEEETSLILESTPESGLPHDTVNKLDQLDMLEYLGVLGRNLQALICTGR